MSAKPEKQNVLFALKNTGPKPIQIICEPACSEYRLMANSEIVLKAEVGRAPDAIPPIYAELSEYGLSLWFEDAIYDPDAEIDGLPTEPFNWL